MCACHKLHRREECQAFVDPDDLHGRAEQRREDEQVHRRASEGAAVAIGQILDQLCHTFEEQVRVAARAAADERVQDGLERRAEGLLGRAVGGTELRVLHVAHLAEQHTVVQPDQEVREQAGADDGDRDVDVQVGRPQRDQLLDRKRAGKSASNRSEINPAPFSQAFCQRRLW